MKRQHYFVIIVLLFFFAQQSFSALTNHHFQPFELNDKLPSNSVVRMYNDAEGYMWFGTKDGLCRFDGYEIKIFRSSAHTPGKLPNNEIQCITGDGRQQLWVGTLEGIVIVDKKNFSVSTFKHPLVERERINSICVDKKGEIWIGTSNNGVLRYNPENESTIQYSSTSKPALRIPDNNVNHIYEDSKGRIWISMWKSGLYYLSTDRSRISAIPAIGKSNNPFRFFEDKEGVFWICTWGDGVFRLNNTQNKFSVQPLQLSAKSQGNISEIAYSIT